MITEDMQKCLNRVVDNSPEAFSVIYRLQWFSKYWEIIEYLDKHGPVGDEFLALYKDKYHCDVHELGKDLLHKIYDENLVRNK